MSKKIKLKQFAAGSCYSYILSSGSEALIIDPHISLPEEYTRYLAKNGLKAGAIIDTHTHADHFSLAAVLKKKLGVPVLMHEKPISEVADSRLKEGDTVQVGASSFKVLYGPGHTDDTINLYGEGKVFTGDVLLIGSVGRTDFQNGSPESMFDTLLKLKALPDDTVVYPGHDYNGRRSSSIGTEKKKNPFMKEADRTKFVENARSKKLSKPFNIDNIIRVNQKGQATALEMISPAGSAGAVSRGEVKLLDVRSAQEYAETHIKDAINIPIDTLNSKINELGNKEHSYIVLCRTGNRSPMAADMLLQSGISGVKVMEGGLTRWQKERLPVVKGPGGISLERQVRIIAGTLVLSGIILSYSVHWAFIFIPVWVSAGLIFAGITDSCLMGILLMKLPYNQKQYKAKLGGGTCSISQ